MKYLIPLLLVPSIAYADPHAKCETSQKVHDFLVNTYGEIPFIDMKDQQGRQFIMYSSPKTSTWTVVIVTEQGLMCGVSSGTDMTPAAKRYETTNPEKKPDIPG